MIWVKGISIGLVVFVIGAVWYVISKLRPIAEHKATSVDLIRSLTIGNLWFWTGLVAALIIGILVAKKMAG